ncbi:AraC family transcriptional regulator [Bifidobacterium reuteri DSM 23975]|uniref:AraC family transcriptional regulator n=1 Tax=Bifidobacterium reuteri DSM 23975 TaxID=1437610 RepID=A0A087CPE6_9BIFI|nr:MULTISPECIES: AraC family transcriptional regulator [Bifidobacterium]KFI85146.1 AraC family transcriptional regulator [Bifidobacterium reuteri DSM 23975]TPF93019.1 hypothetical protein BW14_06790 [Bifidobacterium sp. UTBIF-68]
MTTYEIAIDKPVYYYIAGEFTSEPGWTHARYEHEDDFELIIGLSGHFDLAVRHLSGNHGEQRLRVSPSTCLLLPPRIVVQGAERTGESVDFIWIHFLADWHTSERFQNNSVHSRPSAIANRPADPKTRQHGNGQTDDAANIIHTATHPDAARTFQCIRQREYCPDVNNTVVLPSRFIVQNMNRILLAARNLLSVTNSYRYSQRENDFLTSCLLIELSDDYLSTLANATTSERRTAPITAWIHTNMSSSLSVIDVASHFMLNPDYLTRLFKRENGVTLRDYIVSLRIETAKALLVRTDLPIPMVARYAYFNDARNFMKQFKKHTSLTPTNYRKTFAQPHINTPFIDVELPVPHEISVMLREGRKDRTSQANTDATARHHRTPPCREVPTV